MTINKARLRQLHATLAPIMVLPLLLTLITGSLFQIAAVSGKGDQFLWLLELHRGKFGRINLETIYPFLNALGLLTLAMTGILCGFRYASDLDVSKTDDEMYQPQTISGSGRS